MLLVILPPHVASIPLDPHPLGAERRCARPDSSVARRQPPSRHRPKPRRERSAAGAWKHVSSPDGDTSPPFDEHPRGRRLRAVGVVSSPLEPPPRSAVARLGDLRSAGPRAGLVVDRPHRRVLRRGTAAVRTDPAGAHDLRRFHGVAARDLALCGGPVVLPRGRRRGRGGPAGGDARPRLRVDHRALPGPGRRSVGGFPRCGRCRLRHPDPTLAGARPHPARGVRRALRHPHGGAGRPRARPGSGFRPAPRPVPRRPSAVAHLQAPDPPGLPAARVRLLPRCRRRGPPAALHHRRRPVRGHHDPAGAGRAADPDRRSCSASSRPCSGSGSPGRSTRVGAGPGAGPWGCCVVVIVIQIAQPRLHGGGRRARPARRRLGALRQRARPVRLSRGPPRLPQPVAPPSASHQRQPGRARRTTTSARGPRGCCGRRARSTGSRG